MANTFERTGPLGDVLGKDLYDYVRNAKTLVVGAGGIGCELLKNMATTGFRNIELIDLDTIDVTNLNRQFLFQKQHVGMSKAKVAAETIRTFNPEVKIEAKHSNIMNPEFSVNYFKSFSLVLNALDNIAARNHVNRMCLAADIPLIESGTAGYLGQATVIKKGVGECYECQAKPPPKTYPVCTIRNTPSQPIHCIVWAKFLFSQLFGVPDDENDVTPDTNDPEAANPDHAPETSGEIKKKRETIRMFATNVEFDSKTLFTRLFFQDINTLCSMEKLWEKRQRPEPLDLNNLPVEEEVASDDSLLADQKQWSIATCVLKFLDSVDKLSTRVKNGETDLEWDKDDEDAMDFVTAVANIRARVFGIGQKSRFDIKSMAGKIIPAIATTNAVVAGFIVMEAFKVLRGAFTECRTVFLSHTPGSRGRLLNPIKLAPPNPNCYVCKLQSELVLQLDVSTKTIAFLYDVVLKTRLGFVSPDVENGSQGLISSDPEDLEIQKKVLFSKTLKEMGVEDGARLQCYDDLQMLTIVLQINHTTDIENESGFNLAGDLDLSKAKQVEEDTTPKDTATATSTIAGSNKRKRGDDEEDDSAVAALGVDDDDDLMIIEEDDIPAVKKNKTSSD